MKVYNYDDDGVFSRESTLNDSDRNPLNKSAFLIPAKCTTVPVPKEPLTDENHSWVWQGEWKELPNYIGMPYYDKKTMDWNKPLQKIGEIPDLEKYTIKPPKDDLQYQKFDEKVGDWVEDIEEKEKAEKQDKILDLKDQLKELDIKKLRYLLEKEKGDESGKKYFDAYEAETLKLRNELQSLEE